MNRWWFIPFGSILLLATTASLLMAQGSHPLFLPMIYKGPPPLASFTLAFVSTRDGNLTINRMKGDGSQQIRLTEAAADAYAPAWSPNGSQIAFYSSRDGNYEIYVMNADGSQQIRLTNNTTWDEDPLWSPDGLQLAFTSRTANNTSDLYVIKPDGSALTRLTGQASDVAWSPDGLQLAFASIAADFTSEIYVIKPDGSALTRLTDQASDGLSQHIQPAWSPDGTQIAFSAANNHIYVIQADGNMLRSLPGGPSSREPRWSPDGKQLAFIASYIFGRPYSILDLIRADGSEAEPRMLVASDSVAWSPDGSRFVLSGLQLKPGISGDRQIGVINVDGSQSQVLTTQGTNYMPVWAP